MSVWHWVELDGALVPVSYASWCCLDRWPAVHLPGGLLYLGPVACACCLWLRLSGIANASNGQTEDAV